MTAAHNDKVESERGFFSRALNFGVHCVKGSLDVAQTITGYGLEWGGWAVQGIADGVVSHTGYAFDYLFSKKPLENKDLLAKMDPIVILGGLAGTYIGCTYGSAAAAATLGSGEEVLNRARAYLESKAADISRRIAAGENEERDQMLAEGRELVQDDDDPESNAVSRSVAIAILEAVYSPLKELTYGEKDVQQQAKWDTDTTYASNIGLYGAAGITVGLVTGVLASKGVQKGAEITSSSAKLVQRLGIKLSGKEADIQNQVYEYLKVHPGDKNNYKDNEYFSDLVVTTKLIAIIFEKKNGGFELWQCPINNNSNPQWLPPRSYDNKTDVLHAVNTIKNKEVEIPIDKSKIKLESQITHELKEHFSPPGLTGEIEKYLESKFNKP
jgi:hypothetical protein